MLKINFHGDKKKKQFSSPVTHANFCAGYACTGNTLIDWLAFAVKLVTFSFDWLGFAVKLVTLSFDWLAFAVKLVG